MARSTTRLLLRDELIGFAKSKVMLVLWVILPLIAILGYLFLPEELVQSRGLSRETIPATVFLGLIMSSIAGTVAALMVAVDIISERNRKVYELFVIRPIRREAIIWAKFLAVFTCVVVACLVSLGAGLAIDAIRGTHLSSEVAYDIVKSLVSLVGVIALSCAVGVMFGVLARSILVGVILVLYVGQNVAIVPMLPVYFGWLPNHFWVFMLVSGVLAVALVWGAGVVFRRAQL